MITIERVHEILDRIACELPEEFYRELNGGILLLPEAVESPDSEDGDLFIMGEYVEDPSMGRMIYIYYGSFVEVLGNIGEKELEEELRETLYHEFTHHMESLAGERGLEIEDERKLADYRRRKK
ncbi:MAG TPA: metallopeptidase family protein [Candidatus Copromorpha excrementigallinarum]|uniref:Metallopeptidase family protein n=1 Tax=Candidatus Allocopromorpha excrementigallinarum TaxID=2840742 RepID=A0A9D1HYU9_9FIRM|nr:metallopeptidase family protein [Candidatus Copromorpha excrementigallinarum]